MQRMELQSMIDAKKLEIDEFKAESERLKIMADIAAKDKEFQMEEAVQAAQMENDMVDRDMADRQHTDKVTLEREKAQAASKATPGKKASAQSSKKPAN